MVSQPPLLCIEVLSPEDRWSRVNGSVNDYQRMGVPCVWVIDPYRRRAWIFDLEEPPAETGPDGLLQANFLGVEMRLGDVLPPI
jgi:Uma2 family endonuclease